MPGANFHTVYMSIEVLLVECKACGRRSALGKNECSEIRQGNMKRVKDMKFKCGRHGCGSTDVRTYIPLSQQEVTMWLAGDPLPEGREV